MRMVKLYNAADIDREEWRELQGLSREAFTSTLDRTAEEIDALVEWNDPNRFYASHVDPNTEVGRRYNPNQTYADPRVAVAIVGREPIGWAYSACNASGSSESLRRMKLISIVKNYLCYGKLPLRRSYIEEV